jgi:hypothetical protein
MRGIFSVFLFILLNHSAFGANDIVRGEAAGEMADNCRPILATESPGPGTIYILDKNLTCWGAFSYVQWVFNVATGKGTRALNSEFGACLPDNASRKQLIAIFVSYVDKHPNFMHLPYQNVATFALQEAFPCKR